MVIEGAYNSTLVALSILIAMVASYTALDLAGRARDTSGWKSNAWRAVASVVMGGGIWAMHSIGMLALHLPAIELHYDPVRTIVAFVVPVVGASLSFFHISSQKLTVKPFLIASLFMGGSIASMHYIGVSALEMNATVYYDAPLVVISIGIAIGASALALWLATRPSATMRIRLSAAIALGFAVSLMHYIGMVAMTFRPKICNIPVSPLDQTQIAIAISAASLVILFIVLGVAMFDRRLAQMVARESEALRLSHETFQSLYTRTPSPLVSLKPNGIIEYATDTWLKTIGYSREEVLGRSFFNFFCEGPSRQLLQIDWDILQKDGEIRDSEYRAVTKNGDILDLVLSAIVERTANGDIERFLVAVVDVTDRKRIEKALAIAQKAEMLGQLTGGVAHDFNNLLAVISGNLELARKRVGETDLKTCRYLDNAYKGAQRGASLTQRMLSFARRQELYPTSVDVSSLVLGMTNLIQSSIGPTILIETLFPFTLARAMVDESQLETAILSLVVNSRDAMPNGGKITISATEEKITGKSDDLKLGRYIRLKVTDNGLGMDDGTLARASDPFFTTKGVGKGTGLGLSMITGMAAQSGGCLRLDSQIGIGTSAEIWLPIDEKLVGPALETTDDLVIISACHILVVDDDELVLWNTAAILEDLGHTTTTAGSGEQGLLALKQSKQSFDMIITDQTMPGMAGTQFAEAVHSTWKDMPILIVTGYSELPPGCDLPRLGKPFTQASLSQAISSLLTKGSHRSG